MALATINYFLEGIILLCQTKNADWNFLLFGFIGNMKKSSQIRLLKKMIFLLITSVAAVAAAADYRADYKGYKPAEAFHKIHMADKDSVLVDH